MTAAVFNHRWAAWCRCIGAAVADPKLRGADFIAWIRARWAEWRELQARDEDAPLSDQDHHDFDAWLTKRVDEMRAVTA